MVVNITKIFQKMKSISWLSIEKNTIERGKMLFKIFNFVCNDYCKKDSIKIKKISYKVRIIPINKYLSRLVF